MGQTCSACQVLVGGVEKSGIHHFEAGGLWESIQRGCHLCCFLRDRLTKEEQQQLSRDDNRRDGPIEPDKDADPLGSATRYAISEDKTVGQYLLTYTYRTSDEEGRPSIVKTFLFRPEDDATKDLVPEGYNKPSNGWRSLAPHWISKCERSHKDCKFTRKSNFLPNRLIDVVDGSPDQVSLCVTTGRPDLADAEYMTLSHCWGSVEITRLVRGNLDDMMKGVTVASLPKTFRDAIQVTRELGIRYLWIDSLCIIQDSMDDWFIESSRMGDVYSNSYCTISATAAADGSCGLFLDHECPAAKPLLCIKTEWDGQARKYYESAGTDNVDTSLWSREVDSAPLNQRAWVLQERFLSRRNLMFGRNCLFWECSGNRACEIYPDGLPSSITSTEFKMSNEAELSKLVPRGAKKDEDDKNKPDDWVAKRAWFLMVTGAQVPLAFEDQNNFTSGNEGAPNAYRYWSMIVENYSQKRLTNESDRLIALHGIAQWIQQRYTHDEYVAGMWKEHLLNQLLWTTYIGLKKRRPAAYRAPSWSWASVIGKLMFRDIMEAEEHDKLASVVDVKAHTVEGKEGKVTGGYLRIRSKIVKCSNWTLALEDGGRNPDSKEGEEASPWDGERLEKPTGTFFGRLGDGSLAGYPDVEEDGFRGGETVCLAIQKKDKTAKFGPDETWALVLEGLVLMRLGSESYRRIGFFNAYGKGAQDFLNQSTEAEVEIV